MPTVRVSTEANVELRFESYRFRNPGSVARVKSEPVFTDGIVKAHAVIFDESASIIVPAA